MKVLSVASEMVPLVKTGGLADVAGALPAALAPLGVQMRTLVPGYRGLEARLGRTTVLWTGTIYGAGVRLLLGRVGEAEVILVDAPHLYDRDGGPYSDGAGNDFWDNPERFATLGRMAAEICKGALADGWVPDLVHAHDWQGALAPVYLRAESLPQASLLTIHNIAFQGYAPRGRMDSLFLPWWMWEDGTLEYWDQINVLKAGIVTATRVSTVSPGYAAELRREAFGMGLSGVINARPDGLRGILNGIDTAMWDPVHDPAIQPFSARSMGGKRRNRAALLDEFGLEDTGGPLAIVVSRLTHQKGLDLLPEVLPGFVAEGGLMAVLGTGEPWLEQRFLEAAARMPGRLGVRIGYDEALSHRMFAGADAVLIPSRFEPCGLTQLYGLRYGAVPVVAATGGLADTVIPASPASLGAGVATGIMMRQTDGLALWLALRELLRLHAAPETFARIRRAGMAADFGWGRSAADYAALYAEACAAR